MRARQRRHCRSGHEHLKLFRPNQPHGDQELHQPLPLRGEAKDREKRRPLRRFFDVFVLQKIERFSSLNYETGFQHFDTGFHHFETRFLDFGTGFLDFPGPQVVRGLIA